MYQDSTWKSSRKLDVSGLATKFKEKLEERRRGNRQGKRILFFFRDFRQTESGCRESASQTRRGLGSNSSLIFSLRESYPAGELTSLDFLNSSLSSFYALLIIWDKVRAAIEVTQQASLESMTSDPRKQQHFYVRILSTMKNLSDVRQ